VPTVHAFSFLDPKHPVPRAPVWVLSGDQSSLRGRVLRRLTEALLGEDGEFGLSRYDGETAQWSLVHDELATVSLLYHGPRVVVIEDADPFVTAHRPQLEEYVAAPAASGCLVLVVKSWPGNTRLFKAVNAHGLHVPCTLPQIQRGRNAVRDDALVGRWLVADAARQHGLVITSALALDVLDLSGDSLGQCDQEFAKLALLVPSGQPVTADHVRDIVAGWRTRTVWEMISAAVEGRSAGAIGLLNELLRSGQHPLAIFGAISWSLRRYPRALQRIRRARRKGQRVDWEDALRAAGLRSNAELNTGKAALQRLGGEGIERINHWLIETDLALKGSHSSESRGQVALEKLLMRFYRPPESSERRGAGSPSR